MYLNKPIFLHLTALSFKKASENVFKQYDLDSVWENVSGFGNHTVFQSVFLSDK